MSEILLQKNYKELKDKDNKTNTMWSKKRIMISNNMYIAVYGSEIWTL